MATDKPSLAEVARLARNQANGTVFIGVGEPAIVARALLAMLPVVEAARRLDENVDTAEVHQNIAALDKEFPNE